jgi:hypothetical protein
VNTNSPTTTTTPTNPKIEPNLGRRQRPLAIADGPGSSGAVWVRRSGCRWFRLVRVRGCGRG